MLSYGVALTAFCTRKAPVVFGVEEIGSLLLSYIGTRRSAFYRQAFLKVVLWRAMRRCGVLVLTDSRSIIAIKVC